MVIQTIVRHITDNLPIHANLFTFFGIELAKSRGVLHDVDNEIKEIFYVGSEHQPSMEYTPAS